MENTDLNLEEKDSSAVWESKKGSCPEAPCGAAGQNPVEHRTGETPLTGEEHLFSSSQTPESLQGLTEKVSTLGLQVIRKNRCGAVKKRARKAKLTEAPTADSGSGQPQPTPGDQPLNLMKPGTSGALYGHGPV